MSKRRILLISFSVFIIIGLGIFLRLKWLEAKCPPSTYYCGESLDNKVALTATENEIQIDLSLLGDEWSGQALCEHYLIPHKGKIEDKEEAIYEVYITECKLSDEKYSKREIHKARELLRSFGIFQTTKGKILQCAWHLPFCRLNLYNPLDW